MFNCITEVVRYGGLAGGRDRCGPGRHRSRAVGAAAGHGPCRLGVWAVSAGCGGWSAGLWVGCCCGRLSREASEHPVGGLIRLVVSPVSDTADCADLARPPPPSDWRCAVRRPAAASGRGWARGPLPLGAGTWGRQERRAAPCPG